MNSEDFCIALPNKGRLSEQTINFLKECALYVKRDNQRQYQAKMKGLQGTVNVIFQRVRDIPKLLEDGKADLGITGYDVFCEAAGESRSKLLTVFPDSPTDTTVPGLPFGSCDLVLAVPDHWADVTSLHDIIELAMNRKREGRVLRVATEFPYLTRNFLLSKGISYFTIVDVYGAAERAPKMGSADLISDLKSSGVTLKENRLKTIEDGTILRSSACMIASKERLSNGKGFEKRRQIAQAIVERIESHHLAKNYSLVTANLIAPGPIEHLRESLQQSLSEQDIGVLGQIGPTIAQVLPMKQREDDTEQVYSLSVQIEMDHLEQVIGILRKMTVLNVLVTPIDFVYGARSEAFACLRKKLKAKGNDSGEPSPTPSRRKPQPQMS